MRETTLRFGLRYACEIADDYLFPDPYLMGRLDEWQRNRLNEYLDYVQKNRTVAGRLAALAAKSQLDNLCQGKMLTWGLVHSFFREWDRVCFLQTKVAGDRVPLPYEIREITPFTHKLAEKWERWMESSLKENHWRPKGRRLRMKLASNETLASF